MDEELRKIIENGFTSILDELQEISRALKARTKTLDAIYNHVYHIDRNTS